jgi:hypothetical protein
LAHKIDHASASYAFFTAMRIMINALGGISKDN